MTTEKKNMLETEPFLIEVTPRYAETDQMGYVHHAVYPIWFELARTEMIKEIGISYGELEKKGNFIPVLSLSVRYKSAAYFDEALNIRTVLKVIDPIKMEFEYKVSDKEGKLIAEGSTGHVFLNADKKPIRIPKDFLTRLEPTKKKI